MGLHSLTHTPSASTKHRMLRALLPLPASWPEKRKPLITRNPSRQGPPLQRQRQHPALRCHLQQDHLRPSQEKIPRKLTAGRAGRKDITQAIALAIPRESPSCRKTNHFDRCWLSRLSRPPKPKLRYELWIRTISPFVTTV